MLRLFFLALSLTISATVSAATTGAEKILLFGSSITVNQDTSLDVTETISVYANREQLEHGLVRQLPTTYKDSKGTTYEPSYKIQQVLINGSSTPSHIEMKDGRLEVYIGDANTPLTPGIYSYTLQYHVEHAAIASSNGTDLYWHVTGNSWTLPIYKVEADINLPANTSINQYQVYAGRDGASNQGCTSQQPHPNQLTFATKQALYPGNGLSIAIRWQKAALKQP